MTGEIFRYRAFISYRHLDRDRRWARWLVERLETFRTPRALVRAGAPLHIGRLFRDDDEIPASSDLGHQIEDCLTASQFLIVVCSPDTPGSQWVRREIEFFRKLGRGDHILALLVDGEPAQSFPPELLHAFGGDIEPIAADVRPRHDERAAATERRALLRIAAGLLGVGYDDLARRERQRRIRRQRIQGALAAAVLLLAGGSLFAWWDYNRVKVDYYATIGTRWGQPFGIGALDAGSAGHRAVSYALSRQRGHLIAMKRVNGSGAAVAFLGDEVDSEPQEAGVAEIRIPFPADRPAELDYYDAAGRLLRTEKFTWLAENSASVSLTDANGAAQAVAAAKLSLSMGADNGTHSQVAQYGLRFDSGGLLLRRLYLSVWGVPVADAAGSFGRAYSYTPGGQIASYHGLDESSAMLPDRSGLAAIVRNYDAAEQLTAMEWRNAQGALTLNGHGYARLTIVRDVNGNALRTSYFGMDSRPVLRSDNGHAVLVERYDAKGNVAAYSLLGENGEPVLAKIAGNAGAINVSDAQGRVTDQRYVGRDGRLLLTRDGGFARIVTHYGLAGEILGLDYFGTDGKPILEKQTGVAHVRRRVDSHGRITEESYSGTDGSPAFAKNVGAARATGRYDTRGQLVEKRYYGVDDKPVAASDTAAAVLRWRYDDHGNLIWEGAFGTDGKPVLNKKTGAAAVTYAHDERGNLISQEYAGLDGRLILNRQGVAGTTGKYDARSNLIEQTTFGLDRMPKEASNGVARQAAIYDARGNLKTIRFYDAAGRPARTKDSGISGMSGTVDARGHELSTTYLGPDGKPALFLPARIATEKRVFDERGNIIEYDFFGIDGKPAVFETQGCARETIRFDERNNPVQYNCFGVDGKPALRRETGAARAVDIYNDRGEVIEERLSGLDGKPMNGRLGYAYQISRRDARGNIIELRTLDAGGKPVLATDTGYYRAVAVFNARNLRVDERYYDTEGKPVLSRNKGVARQVQLYDQRDDMVYQLYFGTDGKPIKIKRAGYGLHVHYDAVGRPVLGDEMNDPAEVARLAASVP